MLSVLLGIATARGDRGEPEAGEDIDLEHRRDMVTVVELVAVLVCTIATVDFLGWAITGAVLFAGCAWALGSRTPVRDVVIGTVLLVASWYFFYVGLDVVVVAVGVFAVGKALWVAAHLRSRPLEAIPVGRPWMGRADWGRSWRPWLRGTALGFPFGAVPAGGNGDADLPLVPAGAQAVE